MSVCEKRYSLGTAPEKENLSLSEKDKAMARADYVVLRARRVADLTRSGFLTALWLRMQECVERTERKGYVVYGSFKGPYEVGFNIDLSARRGELGISAAIYGRGELR